MTHTGSHSSSSTSVRRVHRWLALLPPTALLAGIPFANRVEPYVFGLPFLLFWIVLWVVLTGPVMGLIYAVDEAAGRHVASVGRVADDAEMS